MGRPVRKKTRVTIHVPLKVQEHSEASNELVAALGVMVHRYDGPDAPEKEKAKKKRFKSRFFFVPSKSLDEETDELEESMKPRQIVHADEHVTKRIEKLKLEFAPEFDKRHTAVREYFLTEIAPKLVSVKSGSDQAMMMLSQMFQSQLDPTAFNQFEQMSRAAARLMMAEYITKFFGLPKKRALELVAAITPMRPQTVAIPPLDPSEIAKEQARNRSSTTPVMTRPQKRVVERKE